jgi:hypothetical protein
LIASHFFLLTPLSFAENFTGGQGRTRTGVLQWQINTLKFGSWENKLSDELNKVGLGYTSSLLVGKTKSKIM